MFLTVMVPTPPGSSDLGRTHRNVLREQYYAGNSTQSQHSIHTAHVIIHNNMIHSLNRASRRGPAVRYVMCTVHFIAQFSTELYMQYKITSTLTDHCIYLLKNRLAAGPGKKISANRIRNFQDIPFIGWVRNFSSIARNFHIFKILSSK
jgi:hypothetical protein